MHLIQTGRNRRNRSIARGAHGASQEAGGARTADARHRSRSEEHPSSRCFLLHHGGLFASTVPQVLANGSYCGAPGPEMSKDITPDMVRLAARENRQHGPHPRSYQE